MVAVTSSFSMLVGFLKACLEIRELLAYMVKMLCSDLGMKMETRFLAL